MIKVVTTPVVPIDYINEYDIVLTYDNKYTYIGYKSVIQPHEIIVKAFLMRDNLNVFTYTYFYD